MSFLIKWSMEIGPHIFFGSLATDLIKILVTFWAKFKIGKPNLTNFWPKFVFLYSILVSTNHNHRCVHRSIFFSSVLNVKHAMRLNGVFIEMKCLFVYRDAIILWSLHAVCHMHMFIQPEGFYVLLCYFAVFVTQWKPLITTHPGLAKGVISDDIWPLINSIFFQFTCHVSETVTASYMAYITTSICMQKMRQYQYILIITTRRFQSFGIQAA